MNQILSVDMENKKNKKKSGTKSIIIVFCIILIIFALGMIGYGVLIYTKASSGINNGLYITNNSKPEIAVIRQGIDTINIEVSHDKEISYFEYSINDNEPVRIKGNKQIKLNKEITLNPGHYEIKIIVEDIAGIKAEKTYSQDIGVQGQNNETNTSTTDPTISENGPTITLTQEDSKIKAVTESTININKIVYYWDEDKENAIETTINATKNETLIDVTLQGIHTLHITATDADGKTTTKEQKINGVNKPNVNVTTDGKYFIIKASDDEKITKVEYILNKNEKITEDVNSKEYEKNIELVSGENRLTVVVYNNNNVEKTVKVKYTKE